MHVYRAESRIFCTPLSPALMSIGGYIVPSNYYGGAAHALMSCFTSRPCILYNSSSSSLCHSLCQKIGVSLSSSIPVPQSIYLRPYLPTYVLPSIRSSSDSKNLHRLQRVQNSLARVVCDVPLRSPCIYSTAQYTQLASNRTAYILQDCYNHIQST